MHITSMSKKEFDQYKKEAPINYYYIETPAGLLQILFCERGIFSAIFVNEIILLPHYKKSENINAKKFLLVGTEFQLKVWKATFEIPSGTIISYKDLATKINAPQAFRAVANALRKNPIAYFIPCHRVLRKSGDLCGYNWGIERKSLLLQEEGHVF